MFILWLNIVFQFSLHSPTLIVLKITEIFYGNNSNLFYGFVKNAW